MASKPTTIDPSWNCQQFMQMSDPNAVPCYDHPMYYVDGMLAIVFWGCFFFFMSLIKDFTGPKKSRNTVKHHTVYALFLASLGNACLMTEKFIWRSHMLTVRFYLFFEVASVGLGMLGETYFLIMIILFWQEMVEDNGLKQKANITTSKRFLWNVMKVYGSMYFIGVTCLFVSVWLPPDSTLRNNFLRPIGIIMIIVISVFLQICILWKGFWISRKFANLLYSLESNLDNPLIIALFKKINRLMLITVSTYVCHFGSLIFAQVGKPLGSFTMSLRVMVFYYACDLLKIAKENAGKEKEKEMAKKKKQDQATAVSSGVVSEGDEGDSDDRASTNTGNTKS